MAQDTTVKMAEPGQKKPAAKAKAAKPKVSTAPKAAKPQAAKASKAPKAPTAAKAPKAPKAPKAAKPKAVKAAKPAKPAKPAAKPVEVPGNLKSQAAKAVAMSVTKILKKSAATAPAKAYVDELVRRLEAAETANKAMQKKLDAIKKMV